MKKILIFPVCLILFEIFFILLDTGLKPEDNYQLARSTIFALSASFILLNCCLSKKVIGIVSIIMLFMMVMFYLFNQLQVADWIGSLGFGVLIIIIISYLPQLFHNGSIKTY